ncbi:EF-hand domain-containing protein [Streptomyces sp. NPDC100445]|uniref:EF-hand domain-containing protein n=1 Tax=Streptomyces sp. NPDC100445 TaxID=3366102 RepID=UPI0037F26FD6
MRSRHGDSAVFGGSHGWASAWFRGADVDGDGFITQRDVRMMSERYIAARGTAPDSATARLLTEGMDGFWTNVIAPMDQDGDGEVDQTEFQQMFDSVAGVPGGDCAAVFAALDRDGSGALDRAEFHQAVTEFFYGENPNAPANHLFGRVAG